MAQLTLNEGASMPATAVLGANVVDSIMGDLTGEGRDDALLVINPARGDGADGRRSLEVVLMRREADGRLHRAATNARLLACGPCSTSGWLHAQAGSFTVVDAGGGAAAMRAQYRFDYDKRVRQWFLAHVSRLATDPRTGRERRQELDARDLRRVSFVRFDPVRLPAFNEEKSQ